MRTWKMVGLRRIDEQTPADCGHIVEADEFPRTDDRPGHVADVTETTTKRDIDTGELKTFTDPRILCLHCATYRCHVTITVPRQEPT